MFASAVQFDGVLENVSQDTVYNACTHDAVDSVLAGVNACVFCYGQVGRHCRSATTALLVATRQDRTLVSVLQQLGALAQYWLDADVKERT